MRENDSGKERQSKQVNTRKVTQNHAGHNKRKLCFHETCIICKFKVLVSGYQTRSGESEREPKNALILPNMLPEIIMNTF